MQFLSDQTRTMWRHLFAGLTTTTHAIYLVQYAISGYFCFYNDIMMPCFNGMASCRVTTMLSKLQMLPQATDFKWVLVIMVSIPICLLLLPLRSIKWDISVDWDHVALGVGTSVGPGQFYNGKKLSHLPGRLPACLRTCNKTLFSSLINTPV